MLEVTVWSDFEEKFGEFRREVGVAAGMVVEELGKRVRQRVAERTPINTGRASGSWNAALNTPDLTEKGPTFNDPVKAPYLGEVHVAGASMGDRVIVSNSVSYIELLNSGSSLKAPAGFVEAVVEAAPLMMPEVEAAVIARLKARGFGRP